MRRFFAAALVVATFTASALVASAAVASATPTAEATVTVIHGIPNTPVDVYVNNQLTLSNFEFKTVTSPLSLAPGTYQVDIRPAGAPASSTPILSASEHLTAGENATIVANLSATGTPELTTFANPTTPAPAGDAWVLVRHTAAAPAVDVYAGQTMVVTDLTNPNSAGPLAVPAGTVPVSVALNPSTPSSSPVLGPLDLPLTAGHVYIAYAIGDASANPSTLAVALQSYVVGQSSTGAGYDLVGADGGVYSFGNATFTGSLPGLGVHVNDITAIASVPDGKGYWLVGSDGGVYAFGDATFEGSLPGLGVHVGDVVGIEPTADDAGYWLVGADGAVYAFGDATFAGSLPGLGVHVSDIVGIAPTADGGGYLLAASDGGVFSFGDATFEGSLPGLGVHTSDVVAIRPTADGAGYWLVGSDGGVFALGDAPYPGSLPGLGVHVSDIVSETGGSGQAGALLVASDGGVFALGQATFAGSLPGLGVHVSNIVAGSAT